MLQLHKNNVIVNNEFTYPNFMTQHDRDFQKVLQALTAFDKKLSTAIEIFTKNYRKKFLNQLVSSQIDVDRMDYLNRDSFYSGVNEGIISSDRIISMLNVFNNELVVDYKGLYSVEKFVIASA